MVSGGDYHRGVVPVFEGVSGAGRVGAVGVGAERLEVVDLDRGGGSDCLESAFLVQAPDLSEVDSPEEENGRGGGCEEVLFAGFARHFRQGGLFATQSATAPSRQRSGENEKQLRRRARKDASAPNRS